MLQLLIDFFSQLVDDVAVVLHDGPEHGVRKAIRNHENSNADLAVLLPPDISVLHHDRDIVGFDALAVDAAVVAEEGDVLCACVSLHLLRTKQSYRKESLFCTRLREAEGCSCLFILLYLTDLSQEVVHTLSKALAEVVRCAWRSLRARWAWYWFHHLHRWCPWFSRGRHVGRDTGWKRSNVGVLAV